MGLPFFVRHRTTALIDTAAPLKPFKSFNRFAPFKSLSSN